MTSIREILPATIATERLILRAPALADLAQLVKEAGDWAVAEPTARLPHPYTEADGRDYIEVYANRPDQRLFLITGDGTVMGAVGFSFFQDGRPPQLGYWLGQRHWGQGLATEAAAGLLAAADASSAYPLTQARALTANPASIRVLEKIGYAIVEHTHSVLERHRGKPLVVMERRAP
jgi:RimJ/RimL family protein N-acetyltransferase